MKKKVLILLLALCCAASAVFAGGKKAATSTAQPPSEGRVSVYTNITGTDPMLDDLRAKTGIAGEFVPISAVQFLASVFSDFNAGTFHADIIQAPIPVMERLKGNGVLAPYTSPSARSFPDWAKRENDGIYIFGIEYVAILYNREYVGPDDVPKRYQDLADPKWRDMIVMPDPSIHPATISWLVGLREHVFGNNEQRWRAFLQGLSSNSPLFVSYFEETPEVIQSGERPLGISTPKYIVTNAPAPLDWARIEPVMGSPRAMGISAKAPHPVAARRFVDYWLTAQAGKVLADQVGEYVLVPGVFPPIDGMDKARVIPVEELPDEEIARWGSEFQLIFNIN